MDYKLLFVFILNLFGLSLGIFDPNGPARPKVCSWTEKKLIKDQSQIPDCTQGCFDFCKRYPGEYVCTGQTFHIDKPGNQYGSDPTKMFAYCSCTRLIVKRVTGQICGSDGNQCQYALDQGIAQDVPLTDAEGLKQQDIYVDGLNTMIPIYQGQRFLDSKGRAERNEYDSDMPCNYDHFSHMKISKDGLLTLKAP